MVLAFYGRFQVAVHGVANFIEDHEELLGENGKLGKEQGEREHTWGLVTAFMCPVNNQLLL